jgi:hypothetical protein
MILICAVFCRVTYESVILMNLFTVQDHIGLMTYNYYCHWNQMIYHATTLWILYVSVVYQPTYRVWLLCGNIVGEDDAWMSSY